MIFSFMTLLLSLTFRTFCSLLTLLFVLNMQQHMSFLFWSYLFSLSSPSIHGQAASPTAGNANGLSLLGVVAPSQASQANLRRPLRRVQQCAGVGSAAEQNRTKLMMIGFILDLEVCIACCMRRKAKQGAGCPAKAECSWQCFVLNPQGLDICLKSFALNMPRIHALSWLETGPCCLLLRVHVPKRRAPLQ